MTLLFCMWKEVKKIKSKKKNFQKLQLLPLSIYLHKTFAISKYLQFSIYKLNENVGNLPTILETINCQQYWNLNLHHVKTSQLICKGNQLTGVHMIRPPTKTYFQTDPNICSKFLVHKRSN